MTLEETIPLTVRKVLEWVSIADEAIETHHPVCPWHVLRPSRVLLDYGAPTLYQSHVVELILRVVAGEDTRPATNAEMLAAMMMTALKSPLNQAGSALTAHLFKVVMGEEASAKVALEAREQWPGQVQELITELRKKMTQPDRSTANGST